MIAELGSEEEAQPASNTWSTSTLPRRAPTMPAVWAKRGRRGDRARADGPALRVDNAWDLGIDDYTAIWFFQQTGRECGDRLLRDQRGGLTPSCARRSPGGRTCGDHHQAAW
jgi:hypothetical protein